ncbi:MAG TPA: hypothetical protein VEW68_08705 [Patescibacteria group bacterium]|nr:hypothetical protein [Patescibacteria group bacterium]
MKRSAVHRAHASMGGAFELRAGWEVPSLYGTERDEVAVLGTSLGFADVSAQGKIHLSGAVDAYVTKLTNGTVATLGTAPVTSGGLLARIARDWAMAFVPAGTESNLIADLDRSRTDSTMATDVTSAYSSFLVAGPRLEDFLSRSLTLDVAGLKPGTCAAATWAKIPAVLVVRELAAPAVELHVGSDHGRYAWETIRRLAEHCEGGPVGWRALESWGWRV